MNYAINYAISYVTPKQYQWINIHNYYNSLLMIFEILEKKDDQVRFVNTLKLNNGNQFCADFKLYVFNKIPDSQILEML